MKSQQVQDKQIFCVMEMEQSKKEYLRNNFFKKLIELPCLLPTPENLFNLLENLLVSSKAGVEFVRKLLEEKVDTLKEKVDAFSWEQFAQVFIRLIANSEPYIITYSWIAKYAKVIDEHKFYNRCNFGKHVVSVFEYLSLEKLGGRIVLEIFQENPKLLNELCTPVGGVNLHYCVVYIHEKSMVEWLNFLLYKAWRLMIP